MYVCQAFRLIVLMLTAWIVPSVSDERPRTKQQSRGTPVWTDLSQLTKKNLAREANAVEPSQFRSLAVVAAATEDQSSNPALLAAALARGAAFYDDLIALDSATSYRLFSQCKSQEEAVRRAQAEKINLIVWCQATTSGKELSAQVIDCATGKDAGKSFTVSTTEPWLAKAFALEQPLFQQLSAHSKVAPELRHRPVTEDAAAFANYLKAERQLLSVLDAPSAELRKVAGENSLATVSDSLERDPNFLEAYLLKASCQDELGQSTAMQQTLRDAMARKNPARHNPLTVAELEGDYAHFCTSDLEAAMASYNHILEISPSDLRALWSLVDIYLTGDGASKPLPEDINEASNYAVSILRFHPHSAIAQALTER